MSNQENVYRILSFRRSNNLQKIIGYLFYKNYLQDWSYKTIAFSNMEGAVEIEIYNSNNKLNVVITLGRKYVFLEKIIKDNIWEEIKLPYKKELIYKYLEEII
jgi:hypothetical protein